MFLTGVVNIFHVSVANVIKICQAGEYSFNLKCQVYVRIDSPIKYIETVN